MNRALNVRALAAQALVPVLSGDGSLATALPTVQARCPARDQGLLMTLAQGTARHGFYYEALLRPLLRQRPQDDTVRALLLLGAHQLVGLNLAPHAALAETVEAAKQLNKTPWAGLINGTLRNLVRQRATLEQQAASARHAHPDWLIDHMRRDWPERVDAWIEANNQPGPLTLRVHAQRQRREDALLMLPEGAQRTTASPDGIRLPAGTLPAELSGLKEGIWSVQDEAAQLAAHLLAPEPGERILDACAAPGGKSAHLLERQPALAQLICVESDAKRLPRLEENLRRCQQDLSAVSVVHADARHYELPDPTQLLDAILLDAPCTATGVIRRHPDIKWLRRPQDVTETTALQAALLDHLWTLLKPGGRLLYATCSVLKAENEDQITAFLGRTARAQPLPLPLMNRGLNAEQRPQGVQLWPTPQGHDGFFYALLAKLPR